MTVRSVLGHAKCALAPDSVPAMAVSSYLRKAWLPSPPLVIPLVLPQLGSSSVSEGPCLFPRYLLFFRVLIFETGFLFPELSSASILYWQQEGEVERLGVVLHVCVICAAE